LGIFLKYDCLTPCSTFNEVAKPLGNIKEYIDTEPRDGVAIIEA